MVLTLGLATWMIGALIVLFLLVSILMVLVVLVQKPQGGGLSGAFGGNAAASGQTAFGAKTGDALTVMTIGIFVAYLLGAILLNWAARPDVAPPTTPVIVPAGDTPVQPAPDATTPVTSTPPGVVPAPQTPGPQTPAPESPTLPTGDAPAPPAPSEPSSTPPTIPPSEPRR